MIRLALLLLLLGAQDNPCGNLMTQAEMNHCAHEEFIKADAALNSVYNRFYKTLAPERQQKLKEAQRAWLKFRDLECDFQGSEAEGGSMQPMVISDCMADVTTTRVKQLANEGIENR